MTWNNFHITADLKQATIMSGGASPRNRTEGLSLITGSAVRGALAGLAARQHGDPVRSNSPSRVRTFSAPFDQEGFERVFESGLVRFPFLRSSEHPGGRSSVMRCKNDPTHPLVDLAYQETGAVALRCGTCNAALDKYTKDRPKHTSRTRVIMNGGEDAGLAADGGLFSQEELEAGQNFEGEMWVHDSVLDELYKWLEFAIGGSFTVRLGADRSSSGKTTGGLKAAEPKTVTEFADELQRRHRHWLEDGGPHDTLVFYLTSPMILIDHYLQSITAPSKDHVARALGLQAETVIGMKSWVRQRTVKGWNEAAGLPKQSNECLVEGSVISLSTLIDRTTFETIALATLSGIGERRAEGFGQVEWFPKPPPQPEPPSARAGSTQAPNENATHNAFAKAFKGHEHKLERLSRTIADLERRHPSPERTKKDLEGLSAWVNKKWTGPGENSAITSVSTAAIKRITSKDNMTSSDLNRLANELLGAKIILKAQSKRAETFRAAWKGTP
jgi:hypothetical protein